MTAYLKLRFYQWFEFRASFLLNENTKSCELFSDFFFFLTKQQSGIWKWICTWNVMWTSSNLKNKSHLVKCSLCFFCLFFYNLLQVLNTEERDPFPPFSPLRKKLWQRQDRTCTESHGCPWYHVGSCFRSNNMNYQRCDTRRTVLTQGTACETSR